MLGAKQAQLQNSWLSFFATRLGTLTSDATSGVLSINLLGAYAAEMAGQL